MEAIYWASIIILIILIAASIWLLIRGSGNICDDKSKLNETCTEPGDCNCGLVCSPLFGGDGVCKVGSGGVCETSNDCDINLSCQRGVCLGKAGGLNDPCPCGEGLTCVSSVCKIKVGGPCRGNADCADSQCITNVCTVVNPTMMSLIEAAQGAGVSSLTDLVAAVANNNGGTGPIATAIENMMERHECSDSDCDCDGYYKKHKRNRYGDDNKYYYTESDDSYSDYHKKNRSDTKSNRSDCSDSTRSDSTKSDSTKSTRSDSTKSNSTDTRSTKSDSTKSNRSDSTKSTKRNKKRKNHCKTDTDSRSRYYGNTSSGGSEPYYTSSSYKSSKSDNKSDSNTNKSDTCYSSSISSSEDHSKKRH